MDNRIKILIVEDEALIADMIRRTLTGLGYVVCGICYDFQSAREQLRTTEADLFLLDINLGGREGEDGIALAGIIKETLHKPFIFLTAYNDSGTIERATLLHPDNYLIKPVAPADLFAAIQLAIAKAELPVTFQHSFKTEGPLDFFYVRMNKSKSIQLLWREVYCMKAVKNYVLIYSTEQPGEHPIRGSIRFVLSSLVPEAISVDFFKLGRNVCLNRRHITWFAEDVIVCGGKPFENKGRMSLEQFNALQDTPSDGL